MQKYNFFLTYKKKNRFWHIFNIFHSLHTIFPALFAPTVLVRFHRKSKRGIPRLELPNLLSKP